MKLRHVILLLVFLVGCFGTFFKFNIFDNASKAAQATTSPISWSVVKDLGNETRFKHNNLWVYIEDTPTLKNVMVFTLHGLREKDDLKVDYWSYTFSKDSGQVVLSGLNRINIKDYFQGKSYDINIKYLPPREVLNVYTDLDAQKYGLAKLDQGHIGTIFGDNGKYMLPWETGVMTISAQNPKP